MKRFFLLGLLCLGLARAETTVAGEIFLTDGPTKLAGATVAAYPLEEAKRALETNGRPELPPALAHAETDSEGRFRMKLPDNTPYLLMAEATHTARRTRRQTQFTWRVQSPDIQDPKRVLLNERNAHGGPGILFGR